MALDQIPLCDQTLPHVATIGVVKWLCQRRSSARIDVKCSTQSRTGRRTPQIGRFRDNSAGVRERVRTPRRLSGWTYLTVQNRFRPLCEENFGNDVDGCAQDSEFSHGRPRGTRKAILCGCGRLLEVLLGPPDIPQVTLLPVAGKFFLSVLPQALPLPACAGPAAHLPKRSMHLPSSKTTTAAQPSHHATHDLPELITRDGGLAESYTNQVQASTSNATVECKQEHELESP